VEYYIKLGNGTAHGVNAAAYTGPLSWLARQVPTSGSQAPDFSGNDIVIGTDQADLINAGAGNDAINGGAGNDVLDGGLGSNFLTGGAGVDNFFVDGRAASSATTWSTITDFQAGEHVTIWGYQPGVSKFTWVASDGAAGYTGATLHFDLNGNGTTDTSVTFAGLTQAQLPVQTYGTVQGVDYVFIG
jgi:Ca2+-binding RTX toxin-like protein